MASVKHKILVLPGKGGVGKRTFSAWLSFALADMNTRLASLILTYVGPAYPRCWALKARTSIRATLVGPPSTLESNLVVMLIGFILPTLMILSWRGPRKNGLIKQFLKVMHWEGLDSLVVDALPGMLDGHILIVQLLLVTGIDGAIIVTTPQQVSLIDVCKEVSFGNKVGVQVLGVVENMRGLRQAIADSSFMKLNESGDEVDITESVLDSLKGKGSRASVSGCLQ